MGRKEGWEEAAGGRKRLIEGSKMENEKTGGRSDKDNPIKTRGRRDIGLSSSDIITSTAIFCCDGGFF